MMDDKETRLLEQKMTEILWREEKYHVMFYSQQHYNQIRQAMREQQSYAVIAQLISQALNETPTTGSMQNACQHMWGYFKKMANTEEKEQYRQLLHDQNFEQLLHFLKQLAKTYNVTYLLESRILKNNGTSTK